MVLKTAVIVVCMCTFGKKLQLVFIYCENNSCNAEFVTFQSKLQIFSSLFNSDDSEFILFGSVTNKIFYLYFHITY